MQKELERLAEEVRKWGADSNARQKTIDELEAWKMRFIKIARNYADARDNFLDVLRASEKITST
jgi:hypothetical protein